MEELAVNLREVIELVLEGDEPMVEGEIVGRPAAIRVLMSSQGDTDV